MTRTAKTRTAMTRTAKTRTAMTRTAKTRTAMTRTAKTRTAMTRTAKTSDSEDEDSEDERQTVRGDVVGRTATVGSADASVSTELDLATALDIDPAYVRVRAGETVEILSSAIGTEQLRTRLGEAGYEVQTVSQGVSEETREATVDAFESQLDAANIDGEVRFEDGSVVIEADEEVADVLTATPETVTTELSYPDPETGKQRRETILTGADFDEIPGVQSNSRLPVVAVRLTESAGERFATRLVETGFTQDTATGACEFDPDNEDEPADGQFCILTVTDGEAVYGADLNPALANSMESGAFEADRSFVLTAPGEEKASELEGMLRAGVPPAEVRLEPEEGE
jgi:preprotein translocase subunit SecD